ncbi:hypothetical protein LguiA_033427 [Lonicera macranthoides]
MHFIHAFLMLSTSFWKDTKSLEEKKFKMKGHGKMDRNASQRHLHMQAFISGPASTYYVIPYSL